MSTPTPPGAGGAQSPPGGAIVPGVVPEQCQRFLAFDFGPKRTGLATGNRLLAQASAQPTIAAEGAARFAQIAERIEQWQPDALVLGVPSHPDGAAHENTALALRFARQLRERFGLPVFEVDERYSTTEALALRAQGGGARARLRSAGTRPSRARAAADWPGGARDADAAAACIILEQFLRALQ